MTKNKKPRRRHYDPPQYDDSNLKAWLKRAKIEFTKKKDTNDKSKRKNNIN